MKKPGVKLYLNRLSRAARDDEAWFSLPPSSPRKMGNIATPSPLDRRAREQLNEALSLLDPAPAEREKWRNQIQSALTNLEFLLRDESDELEEGLRSKQGKKALERYVRALREVRASYAALNPSIRGFLLLEASAVESDIVEAEAMVGARGPRARNRPTNKRARIAVELARGLLELRGCELTTRLWHRLAQILAGTDRDLRHHLLASGKVLKTFSLIRRRVPSFNLLLVASNSRTTDDVGIQTQTSSQTQNSSHRGTHT